MKKKLLLIISMLAVTFMFAGCSSESEPPFEYDEVTLAQYAKTICDDYREYAKDDTTYNYIVSDSSGVSESEIAIINAFRNMENEVGEFSDFTGEYYAEEFDDSVAITIYAYCTDTTTGETIEAQFKLTFVDNSALYDYYLLMYTGTYGYDEDTAISYMEAYGIYQYSVTEVEIAQVMNFNDKMKAAGTNTLIGMGTVFCVLIFISFIISLLKYVPMLFDPETKAAAKAAKAQTKAVPAPATSAPAPQVVDIVNTATGESAMNDAELVAVITAAVAAYGASSAPAAPVFVNYPSNDKLIVRKIRRRK